ncbi:MAG: S9 family peptidase [Gemmatimonadaceae bacterium]
MRTWSVRFRLAAALLVPFTVSLAAPRTLPAQERFTLAHTRRVVGVGSPTLSADGRSAAFVVSRPNYAANRSESQLWRVALPNGTPELLTPGRTSVSQPQWAPAGRALAFLSPDAEGRNQLWVLPGSGGEARQVTSHPTAVEHFSWRPDGAALAFAATDEEPRKEGEARFVTTFDVGAQDIFLRRTLRPQHIWTVPATGGAATRVTSGTRTLQFSLPPGGGPSPLSWSPDGAQIAFTRTVAPQTGKNDSTQIAVVTVATGDVRALTGNRTFERFALWSPDGRTLAYLQPRDRNREGGFVTEVYTVPVAGGAPRSVTRALDRHILRADWLADGSGMLVAAADQTTMAAWIVPLDGAAQRLPLGDLVLTGGFGADIERSADGLFVFTATSPHRPAELYVMTSASATPQRLTDFNAWAATVAFGRTERVTWRSDNFEADGVLTYPPDFDASRTYPLVLNIHGGPTASSKQGFSALSQLMAADGAIVFEPNYRGSDNLGNAFQAAIAGDAGAGPGRDVMRGVTMLRSRPYVDRTRTVVTGWSYGGFMTSWMIGNYPAEWTAAMAGAPVTDWEDQYNLADGNVNWRYLTGGSPWTEAGRRKLVAQSPITYARNMRTPTLIMSHMEDFRVPPTQALALYRALQDLGVESRFLGFPGRTHNPTDPVMQLERTRLWVEFVKARSGGKVVP